MRAIYYRGIVSRAVIRASEQNSYTASRNVYQADFDSRFTRSTTAISTQWIVKVARMTAATGTPTRNPVRPARIIRDVGVAVQPLGTAPSHPTWSCETDSDTGEPQRHAQDDADRKHHREDDSCRTGKAEIGVYNAPAFDLLLEACFGLRIGVRRHGEMVTKDRSAIRDRLTPMSRFARVCHVGWLYVAGRGPARTLGLDA
jgi:hypothetical protein